MSQEWGHVQSSGSWTLRNGRVASESVFLVPASCWGNAQTQPSHHSNPNSLGLYLPVSWLGLLVSDILFEMAGMCEGGETPRPGCPTELPMGTEVISGQVASPDQLLRTLSLTVILGSLIFDRFRYLNNSLTFMYLLCVWFFLVFWDRVLL